MGKPEQTEKATPKRREEARQRGQVAKSPDLAGAAVFLAGVFALHALTPLTLGSMGTAMRAILWRIHEHQDFTIAAVWMLYLRAFGAAALLLGVLFGAAIIAGVGVNLLQTGGVFSLKPIVPSYNKINPMTGLQRMFSKQVLVNLGKQSLRLAAVALIIYSSVAGNFSTFFTVGEMPAPAILQFTGDLVY